MKAVIMQPKMTRRDLLIKSWVPFASNSINSMGNFAGG